MSIQCVYSDSEIESSKANFVNSFSVLANKSGRIPSQLETFVCATLVQFIK